MADKKLPLSAHLEELRKRILYALVSVGVAFGVSYFFIKEIIEFLMRPLARTLPAGSSLIFTAVPEAFFTYLKAALLAGVFFSAPFILYQLWAFVSPGLYQREKKYALPYLFVSSAFFLLGAAFCYFVVFPAVFRFFLSFATASIRPLPAIKEYLTFTIKLLLAFGLLFQWPPLILFLSRMGVVSPDGLAKNRKYAVLVIFVIAAVITPPDLVSQVLLAAPLLAMYEGSIWMARIFRKKEKPEGQKEEEGERSEEEGEEKAE
jgi:sec-independent protein translocase protein TatC